MEADVIVVGAGVGGVCASIAAAREGANVLLLESSPSIGGTGVHSPVGCICHFWDANGRPVVDGLHRELFPHAYADYLTHVRTYDELQLAARYQQLIAAEKNLKVCTSATLISVEKKDRRIAALTLSEGRTAKATIYIDATGDGNLGAMAGAAFQKGRRDGAMQPATVTFKVCGINPHKFPKPDLLRWESLGMATAELTHLFQAAKKADRLKHHPRDSVLCFPYPDGRSLLFNSTRIHGVDPTDTASVQAAWSEGERQALELFEVIRAHPALHGARIEFVFKKLGVREGRRIVGDYILTADDLLEEARFDDMVAASSYTLDVHDVRNGGKTTQVHIPGSGYYHIPYRCLIAKDLDNLLLGSRCISGTHVAHSSYRVMSSLSAIGQAAGVAAALSSVCAAGSVRHPTAETIRSNLRAQGAFVEEPIEFFPGKTNASCA